jgi:putative ABC transport system permease protein
VFNYVRPFALRKSKSTQSNHYAMFENYFKIGWRNLTKQKMYSSIKIGGFALGIAACFLIALFIKDELSYDTQYPDGDRIYRMYSSYNDDGNMQSAVWFQAPFANALREDYPEIERTVWSRQQRDSPWRPVGKYVRGRIYLCRSGIIGNT